MFYFLDYVVEDSERCRSLAFADAASFKHFNVLMKKSYRTTSWRCLTRMHEAVHDMSRALGSVRRKVSRVHEGVVVASL